MNEKELTVGNCTAEQWVDFWEARGWIESEDKGQYYRNLNRADYIEVALTHVSASVICWVYSQISFLCEWGSGATLTDIETELNELAATRIMGGWA